MSAADKLELLAKTELFSSLEHIELRAVAALCSVSSLKKGRVVFGPGVPGDALFIVIAGEISVGRSNHDGNRQEIARLVAGDLFGELELLTGEARNAEARVEADAALLRFPAKGKNFAEILSGHPGLGARILYAFLAVTAGRVRRANDLVKENSPWVQELRKQVYGDKLTGLHNRTFLEERLPDYLRPDKKLALLMLKPDNFKYVNDNFGHEAGDHALVLIANGVRKRISEGGVAVRYMGNELAVILPGQGKSGAVTTAEGLRGLINGLDLRHLTGGRQVSLSVSIGISLYPAHGTTAPEIIDAAHELPLIGRARGGNLILFPEDK